MRYYIIPTYPGIYLKKLSSGTWHKLDHRPEWGRHNNRWEHLYGGPDGGRYFIEYTPSTALYFRLRQIPL